VAEEARLLARLFADFLRWAAEALLRDLRELVEAFDAESYADVVVYDRDFNVKMVCWRDEDGKLRCVE